LVLANAIYFKGLWDTPFDKTRTSNQPFYLSPTNQLDAPLMHKTGMAGYMENSDFQAVAIFYAGGLDMLVFLPRQTNGCVNLERSLTSALVSATLRDINPQEVEIFLPRFRLESTFSLNNDLARMGMPDAFDDRADFSGMDGSNNLYISGVFHRSWCEVTEDGTEAAATTATALSARSTVESSPPPPPIFRADHPFVFFIRDTRSGSILFLGRLANPSA
jgi:serpin B